MTYAVEFRDGSRRAYGEGTPVCTFVMAGPAHWDWFQKADAYSAAMAFMRGEFEVRGDLVAAIRLKKAGYQPGLKHWLFTALARFAPSRLESWFQSRARAASNIRFHYDRSNEFYCQFLDSHLQYSSAYFQDPAWTLDQAQLAKLDLICRKLDLRSGERFLDVGCGWGGLVMHAAERYGVEAVGCTLSQRQFEHATAAAARNGLRGRVTFLEKDYRDLKGSFQKIASIGMFEHVGRRRLRGYFEKIRTLLDQGGLFLNSGITRPQPVHDDPETLFEQRAVFPGGELPHLSEVICQAENAGLEVLHVEDLRLHYARTCREWVERLQQNAQACLRLVDTETYRTWLLYLSGSALNFEEGLTGMYDVLMGKLASAPVR